MSDYNYFDYPTYDSEEYKYNQYLRKHKNKQNKGATSRDSEREKTYKAENLFMRQVNTLEFNDIAEITKFSSKIYKSKTWMKLWEKAIETDVSLMFNPRPQIVEMRDTKKRLSGYTDGKTVTLCPITGFNKYILLHELAHCLGHMHHGRSFRQCLVSLVGTFMGANEKKILKNEFKRKGLSFGEARKPMSFDNWLASKQRMENMREKL